MRCCLFVRAALAGALGVAAALPCFAQPDVSVLGPGSGSFVISASGSNTLRKLVLRPEVANELVLDMKQKAALEEAFGNGKAQRFAISAKSQPGMTPEDLRRQVEEQLRAQLGDADAKVKEILQPRQYKRLLELDAQWRGPLALADAQVAKRLDISAEHQPPIRESAARYNAVKQEVMASLTHRQENASPDGTSRTVLMRVDSSKLDNKLSPEYKRLSTARRTAEEEILAVLSPEEKARWRAAQGAPFIFRNDRPGERL